ncbi:2-hydroxyacid dehydrogenase [Maribacter arcticus]|uniref:D-lactate dehydrogenase n=1 Tax=Maribacter arcticus TaxID=561365 RepID=A0A1T5CHF6_9FLAO|nr:2-hydroxyacid dehydrogenase [Maribacter arcticus]SKB58786.1 D-lactate dehydrogenase [Maribacter arcticus]
MRTLVYSIHGFDKPFLEMAANDKHELAFTKEPLNENTADLAKGYEAVVLFTSDRGTAQALEKQAAHGIKYLALRSAGFDHVDLAKAKELGMKVAYVPSYSPYAIAEHAVALMLALNRKLILGQELMNQNNFILDQLVGFDLHGKTVGIVGTGKIGGAYTRIMHGFGCKLLGYDIEQDQELIEDTNISYTSLERLCEQSDVISVNCPLNVCTKHMFNKEIFSKMKKGVMFINTARGGVVNTNDLIDALDNGIIAFAGLDVYEYEKPIFFYDHSGKALEDRLFEKLRSYPNVLITGHQAFLTNEALKGIASTTIANLDAWERNEISENEL